MTGQKLGHHVGEENPFFGDLFEEIIYDRIDSHCQLLLNGILIDLVPQTRIKLHEQKTCIRHFVSEGFLCIFMPQQGNLIIRRTGINRGLRQHEGLKVLQHRVCLFNLRRIRRDRGLNSIDFLNLIDLLPQALLRILLIILVGPLRDLRPQLLIFAPAIHGFKACAERSGRRGVLPDLLLFLICLQQSCAEVV